MIFSINSSFVAALSNSVLLPRLIAYVVLFCSFRRGLFQGSSTCIENQQTDIIVTRGVYNISTTEIYNCCTVRSIDDTMEYILY